MNWLYRFRYIVAGVRILRKGGWPLIAAWNAVADDFDNGSDWQHDGYTPEEAVVESLSYWTE